MKKLRDRARRLLCEHRGETLIETIMSTLIFVVVMLAVTFIITTSLKMVQASIASDKELLQRENALAAGEYSGVPYTITFSSENPLFNSQHNVIVGSEGALTAFRPEDTT